MVDNPFYSGMHKKRGMNVQVLADSFGRPLWDSAALPGAVHDVRAAREHGVIDALARADVTCWADKGERGSDGTVRRSHARIRALVELYPLCIWLSAPSAGFVK